MLAKHAKRPSMNQADMGSKHSMSKPPPGQAIIISRVMFVVSWKSEYEATCIKTII